MRCNVQGDAIQRRNRLIIMDIFEFDARMLSCVLVTRSRLITVSFLLNSGV